MRIALAPALRALAVLGAVVAVALGLATSSYATSSSVTANGYTVTASLSPNTVAPGGFVKAGGSVTNNTAAAVNTKVTVSLSGPSGSRSISRMVMIGAGKTLSMTRTIHVPSTAPAGTYTLTVSAQNATTGATAAASASTTVT